MDVKALRYFLAVANEGNLTAAAKSLYLTQPSLSRQIKELERELGCDLFVRHSHSMELTQQGVFLRERAREIVAMVERTTDAFRQTEEDISGTVHIAANESRSMYEVARAADYARRRYPGLTFRITTGDEIVRDQLDKGLADFGVFIQPADLSAYHVVRIPGVDVWGVVMRDDHPLAEKTSVTADDVIDYPAIVSPQASNESYSVNEFTMWFGDRFSRLQVSMTTDLTRNALPFVKRRFGLLYTVEGMAECSPRTGLAFRPLSPGLSSPSDLAWKRHRKLTPAAAAFLSVAEELWQSKQ